MFSKTDSPSYPEHNVRKRAPLVFGVDHALPDGEAAERLKGMHGPERVAVLPHVKRDGSGRHCHGVTELDLGRFQAKPFHG